VKIHSRGHSSVIKRNLFEGGAEERCIYDSSKSCNPEEVTRPISAPTNLGFFIMAPARGSEN